MGFGSRGNNRHNNNGGADNDTEMVTLTYQGYCTSCEITVYTQITQALLRGRHGSSATVMVCRCGGPVPGVAQF